jgi:hypothetical protein
MEYLLWIPYQRHERIPEMESNKKSHIPNILQVVKEPGDKTIPVMIRSFTLPTDLSEPD